MPSFNHILSEMDGIGVYIDNQQAGQAECPQHATLKEIRDAIQEST
jgi:hypothetical protein